MVSGGGQSTAGNDTTNRGNVTENTAAATSIIIDASEPERNASIPMEQQSSATIGQDPDRSQWATAGAAPAAESQSGNATPSR